MSARLPPLNGLRAFEVSARHLSFRKAAAELHVTPAAISQQVRALERQLGLELFHRRVRALELTAAGRAALPHLSEGFERLLAGVEAMHRTRHGELLTVSVSPTFGARWLVPRLERLRAAQPTFDVRLDASYALAGFASDGVDVAIRYGRGHYPPHVVECLMTVDAFPVCSPTLLADGPALACPDDLAAHTLLHSSWADERDAAPSWRMWLRAAGAADVDAERGPRLGSDVMLLEAALEGQGVALLGRVVAARALAEGRLVRPFPPAVFDATAFCYYLVYPERHRASAKVQGFRDWLFDEIARDERAA